MAATTEHEPTVEVRTPNVPSVVSPRAFSGVRHWKIV
jgi:hypothetical protein